MTTIQDRFKPAADKAIALGHELHSAQYGNNGVNIFAVCKKCNQAAMLGVKTNLIFGGAADVKCDGKVVLNYVIQSQNSDLNNIKKENEEMAKKKKAGSKKVSIKDRIREIFKNKKSKLTLDEIVASLNANASTVRTAIADLRSKKYAGKSGIMVLKLDDKKRYCRASN